MHFYIPKTLEDRWKLFLEICDREGSSASEKITEYVLKYVDQHKHGNPQELLDKHVEEKPKKKPKPMTDAEIKWNLIHPIRYEKVDPE